MTDTVSVPREPTRKMINSGASACEYEIGPAKIKAAYRAMIAAAPKAEPDWNYEGALADLDSAITVLIRRINGEADLASAAEWVRLNYPSRASEIVSKPEAPKVEKMPVLNGITLEGTQGEPAGMMTVKAELSDGRQVTLIQSNGNNIYHWASTCNLPITHPAPASDELLKALEEVAGSAWAWPRNKGVKHLADFARDAIAKHKGPQS